jgi:hypothetical protein
MQCEKCGRAVEAYMKFCPSCGTGVVSVSPRWVSYSPDGAPGAEVSLPPGTLLPVAAPAPGPRITGAAAGSQLPDPTPPPDTSANADGQPGTSEAPGHPAGAAAVQEPVEPTVPFEPPLSSDTPPDATWALASCPPPHWSFNASATRSRVRPPPQPGLSVTTPDPTPGSLEWADDYKRKHGGFEAGLKRLKQENALLLCLIVLDGAAFVMTGSFGDTNRLGVNVGLAMFLVVGALILIDAIRIGLAIKYRRYVWFVLVAGIVPGVSIFVGLFVMVQLSQAMNVLRESQYVQAGSSVVQASALGRVSPPPVIASGPPEVESPAEPA